MSTYSQIFEKNKYNLPQIVNKSKTWFESEVNKIKLQGRIRPYYLMRAGAGQNRSNIIPGEMYMFYYNAKYKEELPYWDQFPLVFPFRKLKGVNNVDGFLGLNMHYLPYHLRIRLLDRLMVFKTNSAMDENTRLRFSWQVIDGIAKFRIAKQCVHHYLLPHVKSVLKKVESENWTSALMMPVEQFTGATKYEVWSKK